MVRDSLLARRGDNPAHQGGSSEPEPAFNFAIAHRGGGGFIMAARLSRTCRNCAIMQMLHNCCTAKFSYRIAALPTLTSCQQYLGSAPRPCSGTGESKVRRIT